jgi:hypothetical protein
MTGKPEVILNFALIARHPRDSRRDGSATLERGSNIMLDHDVLKSVAEQMMRGSQVEIEGKEFRVSRTGSQRLRTVRFLMGGREYQAIEQNPERPSQWGKLAREGRRVVQVRDLGSQKYVAVVVDDKVREYGRR